MSPHGPKRIRALDRGLSVVEHLSNAGLSTLADLRNATGLTNATLLRVLATLQDRGWVRRNIVEGQYELAHSLGDVLGANARAHPLAEIAAPYLLDMRTRQLGFPSDLCALIGVGQLEVVESTRIRGPLAPSRTGLGIRPSMIRSAHGRAFLAFAPKPEFDVHMEAVRTLNGRADRQVLDSGEFDAMLKQARETGYGLRDDDYFVTLGFDPGPDLAAISVPILSETGIHGTLSVLWLRDDTTNAEVLALGSLDDMRSAALRIGAAMDRRGIAAPTFSGRDTGQ